MNYDSGHAENIFDKNSRNNFSNYGRYVVDDSLTLTLPNTKIHFRRISDDKYSYSRENTQSGVFESIISVRTENLEFVFVPSFPIHIPAYRTDYVFLKLTKPIFISMKSSTAAYVPVPIENAIFFTGNEIREHIDVFSCVPDMSRFGLYGAPENGKLAKIAKTDLEFQDVDFEPFLYAKMKVMIENDLKVGFRLGKLVFPVTNHDLYYRKNTAVFDPLKIIMKDRLGVDYPDVRCEDLLLDGWEKAPRHAEKTIHEFSMNAGFE